VKNAYLLAPGNEGLEVIEATNKRGLALIDLEGLEKAATEQLDGVESFKWRDDTILPLSVKNGEETKTITLGYLGISNYSGQLPVSQEEQEALRTLIGRATMILKDRSAQEQLFVTMDQLSAQNDLIQQLRVAGRFNRNGILNLKTTLEKEEIRQAVKDALTHYWGGPRLTDSPLMKLKVVQGAVYEGEQNSTNALRSVLKSAIEQLKPEGDRKYTGEWLLYNILELKFLEGKKVREIALKLALSEADLYRKQRVAIDLIADEMVKMELKEKEKAE
jgi:hypothetical protein